MIRGARRPLVPARAPVPATHGASAPPRRLRGRCYYCGRPQVGCLPVGRAVAVGVRTTSGEGKVALFDSVSGFAFGPVFDSDEEIDAFLDYAREHEPRDLRALTDRQLTALYETWVREEDR